LGWICGAYRDDMFVNVIPVDVVQVTVIKIVNMAVMAGRRMPAIRAMLVGMVWMLLFSTGGHGSLPLFVCNPIGD
jgi:hypothetical protein